MKKFGYILIFLTCITTLSCQSVEVISISEKQTKVSDIRNYLLIQSIFNLETTDFTNLSLFEIIGEAYPNLDLQKNQIPYLNSNLKDFDKKVHLAYLNSLFKVQQILINYSDDIEYPLLYPDVNNRYIINEKSTSVLFDQFRDEIYLEMDNVLDEELDYVSKLYTQMATEYNIYCNALENLNRQSPPTISTNILPRMKTVFIKELLSQLSKNEEVLNLLYISIDPNDITIN
ncbi:MAG: hypothetical protein PQJ49_02565 [Sphaerochaetaceae bacterium]|nr:hypothetical protein [Sphaerochaetaceae bacterium]MDC7248784.1 hypothetical protein [Sphaerochaetaceae bacterium]